ncbi:MAG: DUF2087 domain-containing protein [Spirochaetes bacterium]|nr:DUF2087 domain-containing protein [Spirochaetota bacterium]
MNESQGIWNCHINELKRGYIKDKATDSYVCLFCGKSFPDGYIYPVKNDLLEAKLIIKKHITAEHESTFQYLVNLDKKSNGISSAQKKVLLGMYLGQSDSEIAAKAQVAKSTIRNQRFQLKEKLKEARLFVAIMELLNERLDKEVSAEFIDFHHNIPINDDRTKVTQSEQKKIIAKYFTPELNQLLKFPKKEKEKLVVLRQICRFFEGEQKYTEKEVNEILKALYEYDYVTIRRYLIEYQFLARQEDCSEYWVTAW